MPLAVDQSMSQSQSRFMSEEIIPPPHGQGITLQKIMDKGRQESLGAISVTVHYSSRL
jgi:hypothetical protein